MDRTSTRFGEASRMALYASKRASDVLSKVEERAAARYMRLKSLLDSADAAIEKSKIPQQLKNRLGAKLLRARKALNAGKANLVTDHTEEIITILRQAQREDKLIIEKTADKLHLAVEALNATATNLAKTVNLDLEEVPAYTPHYLPL